MNSGFSTSSMGTSGAEVPLCLREGASSPAGQGPKAARLPTPPHPPSPVTQLELVSSISSLPREPHCALGLGAGRGVSLQATARIPLPGLLSLHCLDHFLL